MEALLSLLVVSRQHVQHPVVKPVGWVATVTSQLLQGENHHKQTKLTNRVRTSLSELKPCLEMSVVMMFNPPVTTKGPMVENIQ